jgi:hypothetical protein
MVAMANDVRFDDLGQLSLAKSVETTDGKNVGIHINVCQNAAMPYSGLLISR